MPRILVLCHSGPAEVEDRAVAEHFEVLGRVLFGRSEFVVILVPNGDSIPAVTTAIAAQFEAGGVRLLDDVAISGSREGELDFEELTVAAEAVVQ